MKKLFILLMMMFYIALSSFSQKVKIDNNGNYRSVIKIEDRLTGKMFIDDQGFRYAMYVTNNNKLYYFKLSEKTNKLYKVYIKKPLDTFDKPYSIKIMDEHEVMLIYKTDTVRLYFENAYRLAEEEIVFVTHK